MYIAHEAAPTEPEGSSVTSLLLTFAPLGFMLVLFVAIIRLARSTRKRSDESLALLREMTGELRRIRGALEKAPPDHVAPK